MQSPVYEMYAVLYFNIVLLICLLKKANRNFSIMIDKRFYLNKAAMYKRGMGRTEMT